MIMATMTTIIESTIPTMAPTLVLGGSPPSVGPEGTSTRRPRSVR